MPHGLPDSITKDERALLEALPPNGSRLGIEYLSAQTSLDNLHELAANLVRKDLVQMEKTLGYDRYLRKSLRLTERGQKLIDQ